MRPLSPLQYCNRRTAQKKATALVRLQGVRKATGPRYGQHGYTGLRTAPHRSAFPRWRGRGSGGGAMSKFHGGTAAPEKRGAALGNASTVTPCFHGLFHIRNDARNRPPTLHRRGFTSRIFLGCRNPARDRFRPLARLRNRMTVALWRARTRRYYAGGRTPCPSES